MALSIASTQVEKKENTLGAVAMAAYLAELRFKIEPKQAPSLNETIEIYIDRNYGSEDVEYFYMDIINEEKVKYEYDTSLLDVKIDGTSFYIIAGTDNAHYSHLMYQFALHYLRLKPLHYVGVYDVYFSHKEMETFESEGGWYNGWTIKAQRKEL